MTIDKNLVLPCDVQDVSDGYHTFRELYEHRCLLYILVLTLNEYKAWKSKLHDDGTMYDGWFIAGFELKSGPITYHLPIEYWDLARVKEIERAPKWDGHTPADVVHRLKTHLGAGLGSVWG